jgi:tyrosyl-tRNA synthetase
MSISDELMLRYYELLSTISLDDLKNLKGDLKSGKAHPMDAKRGLAREIVQRFHSDTAAVEAELQFSKRFSERKSLEDLADDDSIPVFRLNQDMPLFKVLQEAGITKSSSEAIRLIKAGAVKIKDEKVLDTKYTVNESTGVIKAGKKFIRVER